MHWAHEENQNNARRQRIICSTHLAENNGHEEKVEQQRLRQVTVVEGEEEDGEEDGHVLVGGTAVGGTKQLQAGHCDHQSSDPGGCCQTGTQSIKDQHQ